MLPLIRSVVDTNLFVRGLINRRGWAVDLLQALRSGRFRLILSEVLHHEYVDVFFRPRFQRYGLSASDIAALLSVIRLNAIWVDPLDTVSLAVRDTKDIHVLATALGGNAEYLVTDDNDLLVLRDDASLAPLRIVTIDEFLKMLDATQ